MSFIYGGVRRINLEVSQPEERNCLEFDGMAADTSVSLVRQHQVKRLEQVLCDADSQEPETVHLLHLSSTDVDRGVCLCLLFSKINDQLLGFVDVEQ